MKKKKGASARKKKSAPTKPPAPDPMQAAFMQDATDPDRTRRTAKKIRNQKIVGMALTGKKTTQEIADDVGLCRQTVSEILNSDEAQEFLATIEEELARGLKDSVKTVLDHVKFDYLAARDLLRNFGHMRDKKSVEVSAPGGGPIAVKSELKVSIEERVKLLKGEA